MFFNLTGKDKQLGNIPYDATEEQLIEICREVGPVVSFRLVTDRETGKPKGYGFCEYKDEETALSACRNLLGYKINGRQLRVDFAENDKKTDKNRELGRGGQGLSANVDSQRQVGAPVNQPTGVQLAETAFMVMTGALGGPQAGIQSNQRGLQSQTAFDYDPLTSHLAKLSRSQLIEIMSELKMMATKDKDLARQLLLSRPQLSKALFQAQIMLNMVTPQVLQMPNLQQPPGQLSPGQSSQLPQVQTTMGLPPSALDKLPSGVVSKSQQIVASILDQNKVLPNQFTSSIQQPVQLIENPDNHVVLQNTVLEQSGSMLSSVNLQSLISMPSVQPNQPGQGGALSLHSSRANNIKHSPLVPHPPLSDVANKEQDRPPKVAMDANWIHRSNTSNMLFGSTNPLNNLPPESPDPYNRASKLILSYGRRASYSGGPPGVSITNGLCEVSGFGTLAANAVPNLDLPYLQQQSFQTLLPAEAQFTLLQQVLSLTPEQLSSLPVEQQQLVIQLQEAIRRDQIWPSQPY